MTGHRPFKDLIDKMPPESGARVKERVEETLNEMQDERREQDALPVDDRNAPCRAANAPRDKQAARDLEIINRRHAQLNREAEDVLAFQDEQ